MRTVDGIIIVALAAALLWVMASIWAGACLQEPNLGMRIAETAGLGLLVIYGFYRIFRR